MFRDIEFDAGVGPINDRKIKIGIWVVASMFDLPLQVSIVALRLATIGLDLPIQINARIDDALGLCCLCSAPHSCDSANPCPGQLWRKQQSHVTCDFSGAVAKLIWGLR